MQNYVGTNDKYARFHLPSPSTACAFKWLLFLSIRQAYLSVLVFTKRVNVTKCPRFLIPQRLISFYPDAKTNEPFCRWCTYSLWASTKPDIPTNIGHYVTLNKDVRMCVSEIECRSNIWRNEMFFPENLWFFLVFFFDFDFLSWNYKPIRKVKLIFLLISKP